MPIRIRALDRHRLAVVAASALTMAASACSAGPDGAQTAAGSLASLPALDAPALSTAACLGHLEAMAHDSMQGRGTGHAGGEMAAAYIEQAFRAVGLDPARGLDGYRQEVPILGTRVDQSSIRATIRGTSSDIVVDPREIRVVARVEADSLAWTAPLVFVGGGVVAPQVDWDDYEGRGVEGAFGVMDDIPDALAASLPPGAYELTATARTNEALGRGARGVVTLSPPGSEEQFERARAFDAAFERLGDPSTEGFVSVELGPGATRQLLDAGQITWEDLAAGAPLASQLSLSLTLALEARTFSAPNIVGVVEGTGDESVVVTAHYDAYGIGPANATGDSIYNGAADNASGTAGLIELARDLATRPTPPQRTVVFVATTAEERGKLGARYYVDRPVGSRGPVVFNLNVDGLGFSPPTEDFAFFPSSGLDVTAVLSELAAPLGMRFGPQAWHEGMHFSFDTEAFLTAGIPAITVWQGQDVREAFRESARGGGPIHTPDDQFRPGWPEAGVEQHLELHRRILEYYADGGRAPALAEDHPFGNR